MNSFCIYAGNVIWHPIVKLNFASNTNHRVNLNYISGHAVRGVFANVDFSTSNFRCYRYEGGLGQGVFKMAVEAYGTRHMHVDALFYG